MIHGLSRYCCLVLAFSSLLVVGCELQPKATTSPYSPPSESARDPQKAQQLTLEAVALLDDAKIDEAELLLQQALTADLYYGPAHNNLGVVLLAKQEYYEAANEFEWARKLMPGHPDPRMNLALTLEQVGRIDDAIETYVTALEVYPNHLPTIQALCRCQIRHDRENDQTTGYLKEIALRGETSHWRQWAKAQLTRTRE